MNTDIEKFISLYSRDLTKLCLNLCGNVHDAEDLFQDTWIKVYRYIDKYDSSKPFDKWLFSICVNTYKNNLKLSFNKRRVFFESEEESQLFFSSIPDESCYTKVDYAELHKVIGALPKKQKLVIVLKFFRDLSVSEVAQILRIPEGTVKSRLHQAKKTIRRRLSNEN